MEKPALPEDEPNRLASLQSFDVLDTPAEERFDRITRLAKALFDVPIALVSLVDEKRQWFKSRQGISACETSREMSFCGHAILRDEVLWIEDARREERFHDNPLVVGPPNIRFYAGCPLRDREGHRLGTLCVIDSEPRPRSAAQLQHLADLGRVAENELTSLQLGSNHLELVVRAPEERKERLDEVTGVWNRAGMLEILAEGLDSCAQNGWAATILLCEIEGGASLGETWSDEGRDLILAEAAQILRGCIRAYDSVGRTGAGEFLLLLSGLAPHDAETRVAFFQKRIDENPVLASIGLRMHFGFASTQTTGGASDSGALIEAASESLARVISARVEQAA